LLELIATGIDPDSQWIPFSFRAWITGLRKTKCGANTDKFHTYGSLIEIDK